MELTIWRKAIANISFIPLTTSGMWPRELARGSITTLRVAICFSVSALCYTHTGFHTDGFSLPRLDYCHCRSDSSLLSAILVMSAPLYTRTARSFTQTLSRYEASRQEAHPYNFYSRNPDAGWSSIDVQLRIYTLEQMKRQEHKQRFYLWDYIWWYGERWGQVRRTSRMDGSFLLYCYIMSLIILPLMVLSFRIFSDIAMIQLFVWIAIALAGHSWVQRIYRRRGKAVLKHYYKRSFYEAVAVLLFILSTAILCFLMYCYEYYIPKS